MADALSRHSVNTLSTGIDILTMARDQISENVAAEVADSSLVLDWVTLRLNSCVTFPKEKLDQ